MSGSYNLIFSGPHPWCQSLSRQGAMRILQGDVGESYKALEGIQHIPGSFAGFHAKDQGYSRNDKVYLEIH